MKYINLNAVCHCHFEWNNLNMLWSQNCSLCGNVLVNEIVGILKVSGPSYNDNMSQKNRCCTS